MERYLLRNGKELSIRVGNGNDAEEILKYLNICGKETDFLGFGVEGIGRTVEEEKRYLENFTSKNFLIIAIVDGEIVGSCSISTREERVRLKHRGTLGICVLKKFWGLRIGEYLIKSAIERCEKAGITKLELETRLDNERAIALYKKLGFKIEGTIEMAVSIDGIYYDNYFMGKVLK